MSELCCRLCAVTVSESASEIIEFSSNNELKKEITQNLSIFAELLIDFNDKSLPEAVCSCCREFLRVCCDFFIKIRQSQVILRSHKKENKLIVIKTPEGPSSSLLIKEEPCSDNESKDAEFDEKCLSFVCETTIKSEQNNHFPTETSDNYPFYLNNDRNIEVEIQNIIDFGQNSVKIDIEEEVTNKLNYQEPKGRNKVYRKNKVTVTSTASVKKTIKREKCASGSKPLPSIKNTTKQHPSTKNGGRGTKGTKFTCEICHKEICSPSKFKRHMIIHTKRSRHFKCDECDKSFYSDHDVRLHKYKTHIFDPQECPVCKNVYQNKAKLNRHSKYHLQTVRFECDTCHRSFATKGQTATHIKTVHTNITPHLCKFCGKGFKHRNNLIDHENVHKKEKPYMCTECGREFTMWGNCDKHMKRIHGITLAKTVNTPLGRLPIDQTTFNPEELEAVEINATLVNSTLEMHADFTCEGCGKKFDSKAILADHEKIAHQLCEAQVCPICKAELLSWDLLKKHLKKRHKQG